MVRSEPMSKDRVVDIKPISQATRDRDLVIRTVRDELVQFMRRKFAAERGRDLKALGPDVGYMVETLAEAMAVLHVDVIRSIAEGDVGGYERKLAIARASELQKK
jgi:hypothetical protein